MWVLSVFFANFHKTCHLILYFHTWRHHQVAHEFVVYSTYLYKRYQCQTSHASSSGTYTGWMMMIFSRVQIITSQRDHLWTVDASIAIERLTYHARSQSVCRKTNNRRIKMHTLWMHVVGAFVSIVFGNTLKCIGNVTSQTPPITIAFYTIRIIKKMHDCISRNQYNCMKRFRITFLSFIH